jgi:membrane protein DedA with SNARE-associated domain
VALLSGTAFAVTLRPRAAAEDEAPDGAAVGEEGHLAVVESLPALLAALPAYSPYVALFALLVVGIWVIPFAEEIALTSAGYLYFVGDVHLAAILGVAGAGVFLGDFVAFALGRGWGSPRWRQWLMRRAHRSWCTTVGTFIDSYGPGALFWSRFLPGVRLPAHLLAGLSHMSVATYLYVSLLSVAVYVPVPFTLAYSFGEEIGSALPALRRMSELAWALCCLGLGVWGLYRLRLARPPAADRHEPAA